MAGVADYIARGLKCPACGIGFMPVKVETRERGNRKAGSALAFWIGIGVVALVLGVINIWMGVAIAVIALLAGIFVRLGQIAKK